MMKVVSSSCGNCGNSNGIINVMIATTTTTTTTTTTMTMRKAAIFIFVVVAVIGLASLGAVEAHRHSAYNHVQDGGGNWDLMNNMVDGRNWMSRVSGDSRLSELSIPGTHNTVARHGGVIAECQSMPLGTQLEHGIRALDVRCRHYHDSLPLHHGVVYQMGVFADVLETIVPFLMEHPSETIVMRIKEEFEPESNTRSFDATLREYLAPYSEYLHDERTDGVNPTLDEVRGKFVILDYYGSGNGGMIVQDEYRVPTRWDLYDKWIAVKDHLFGHGNHAERGSRYFVNFLSGTGPGALPFFVASGHYTSGMSSGRRPTGYATPFADRKYPDFPRVACAWRFCTIVFEGTNVLFSELLDRLPGRAHTGIVFSDFPGPGLIRNIVAQNDLVAR